MSNFMLSAGLVLSSLTGLANATPAHSTTPSAEKTRGSAVNAGDVSYYGCREPKLDAKASEPRSQNDSVLAQGVDLPPDPVPGYPGPYDPGPYDPNPPDPAPGYPGPYDPGPSDPGPYDPGPDDPGRGADRGPDHLSLNPLGLPFLGGDDGMGL